MAPGEYSRAVARAAHDAPRTAPAPVRIPLIGKILLGGIALVVLAVSYPWLWWQDRLRLTRGAT